VTDPTFAGQTFAGPTFAVVTGGGTGGHVYPALAFADELVRRGHSRDEIHFVGAARGLEARVVPDAGYSIDLLPGRGLQRSLAPRALLDNAAALWATLRAFGRAWQVLAQRRPAVVVGVGGYASLPCVLAARLRRVPVVVHEQNAAPGLANRVAVRLGARAAISLPGTPLRGAVLTGNPIRAQIAAVRPAPGGDRSLVGAFGGSLGARHVNDAVLDLAARWRSRDDRAVRHVSGVRDHERCAGVLASVRTPGDTLVYDLVPYEEHMEELYAHASVAVCRAGAVTVAELTAAGLPAVLVPLPGAPGDHQTRNADTLVAAGAAVAIPDAQLDGARLAATLDGLLTEPDRLATMRDAARSLARVDAASKVADLVDEVARAR
jgi:UDP-N-acetylglucosamine--N-acetylmuramyl-(pentapeptide) pyrophosphoryl-undecaprenol N-acetylglucosamine transferase